MQTDLENEQVEVGTLTPLQTQVYTEVCAQLKSEPWFPMVTAIPTGLPTDEEIKKHGRPYWIKKMIREMKACYSDFEVE
jgi:hypothetical protein